MSYKDPIKNREAKRKYYLANKDKVKESARRERFEKRAYVAQVKNKPCMDCQGIFPWYVMDLDHRNADEKLRGVSQLIVNASWKVIKEEIEKCDVVCSNCHRIRTYTRKQRFLGQSQEVKDLTL